MFKFVVLSCLVSVAFAGILHAPAHIAVAKQYVENHQSIVETPTISHVGTKLSHVPTGVSHHSSSVVHSHAHVAEPVYAHGVQKTIVNTPVVKKIVEHVPAVVHHEPYLAKTIVSAPVAYHAAPVVHHASPVAYHAAPVAYHAAPVVHHASPIAYSSSYALPAAHASYAHHW